MAAQLCNPRRRRTSKVSRPPGAPSTIKRIARDQVCALADSLGQGPPLWNNRARAPPGGFGAGALFAYSLSGRARAQGAGKHLGAAGHGTDKARPLGTVAGPRVAQLVWLPKILVAARLLDSTQLGSARLGSGGTRPASGASLQWPLTSREGRARCLGPLARSMAGAN